MPVARGGKAERTRIRALLREQGRDHPDEVADAFLRRWPRHLSALTAYRHVHELSQSAAAEEYNALTGRHHGDKGFLDRVGLARLEGWPGNGSRPPTAGELTGLARVYGASAPRRLVRPDDWARLDPSDRIALLHVTGGDPAPAPPAFPPVATGRHPGRPPVGDTPPAQHPTAVHFGWSGSDGPEIPGGGPADLERQVMMAAHESAQFGDHPSNVGDMTLELLRSDVTRLSRMFANTSRLEVFRYTRFVRDRIFALLDGRQRVAETRDLYFLAGATVGMLAEITKDLGFTSEAMTHTRTAWLCARESGDSALMAWVLGMQSLVAYWDGRPGQATDYARQGQEFTTTGTVGVWLPALEARARSDLGDRKGTRDALQRAAQARADARPDDLDAIGGILTFHQPKQHYYAAGAYLGLGDGRAVVPEATACVEGYRSGPDEQRAFDVEAEAQASLAVAHVLAGDLEAARDAAQPALGIAPELRIHGVDQNLRRLHRRLADPAVRDAPVAVQLRDQIEAFLSTPTQTIPGR